MNNNKTQGDSNNAGGTYQKADSPHLTEPEVLEKLKQIDQSEGQDKRDLMTELAWRPAWAIRSRRGTWGVLKAMFGRRAE